MALKTSAGLLMYRIKDGKPEIFLVHPGGPFWSSKDDGVWGLPKGEADEGETGETLLEVAKREFEEETSIKPEGPFHYLGKVVRGDGRKEVEAWAFEGDCDPSQIKSNMIEIEWPPRSGKKLEIPEVDRGDFFTLAAGREKMQPYQIGLITPFEKFLNK